MLEQFKILDLITLDYVKFDPDFEEANFTEVELAEAASAFTGASISPQDINSERTGRDTPLGKALDRVARKKLHPDLKSEKWGRALARFAKVNHRDRPIDAVLETIYKMSWADFD